MPGGRDCVFGEKLTSGFSKENATASSKALRSKGACRDESDLCERAGRDHRAFGMWGFVVIPGCFGGIWQLKGLVSADREKEKQGSIVLSAVEPCFDGMS